MKGHSLILFRDASLVCQSRCGIATSDIIKFSTFLRAKPGNTLASAGICSWRPWQCHNFPVLFIYTLYDPVYNELPQGSLRWLDILGEDNWQDRSKLGLCLVTSRYCIIFRGKNYKTDGQWTLWKHKVKYVFCFQLWSYTNNSGHAQFITIIQDRSTCTTYIYIYACMYVYIYIFKYSDQRCVKQSSILWRFVV